MNRLSPTRCDAGQRPVVLITPDLRGADTQHMECEFAVRANYAEAVREAGGMPVILPFPAGDWEPATALAGGIIITGTMPGYEAGPERRAFESGLIRHALDKGIPLLGICNGMQSIGEVLGGNVLRDIPELSRAVTPHIPRAVPDRLAHAVSIEPATRLFALNGGEMAEVNSLHRHVLDDSGRYRVVARAPDGIVEAIEGLGDAFCMGVQWHPEYRLTPLDRAIMAEFVSACAAFSDAGEAC